ncbi:MAG: periplasmic heavy metal sensor [Desulfobacterales bacterium]
MPKKWIMPMLLLIFVSIPYSAGAQDMPPGRWWKDPKVVKDLDLSESQVSRLDEAFQESRRNLIRLKGELESHRFELETLLESETLDKSAIQSRYEKLEKAKQALGREIFQFIVEIRKIVGPEKFSRIKSEFFKFHHSRFGKDRSKHR